ncbi:hypothetical protein SLEP1_g50913 [Rubroshorea leprosula]|uniref:Uncharacterized protein n=1 Tax=Rubroshorea leprosula TaxID=152421 RepID=A0AAV5M2Z7_9ROSI|nr:hypothetical protein SLEP1_g50913 [Rubroshorea leprosula]
MAFQLSIFTKREFQVFAEGWVKKQEWVRGWMCS